MSAMDVLISLNMRDVPNNDIRFSQFHLPRWDSTNDGYGLIINSHLQQMQGR